MDNETDAKLETALRDADPATGWTLKSDALDNALKELRSTRIGQAIPPRARNRKGGIALVVAGVVALAGVGVASPAAAGFLNFLAQTGEIPPSQPSASGTPSSASEFIPGSELIRPLAPDYADFARTKYGDLPLPSGYDEALVKSESAELEAEIYRRYSGGNDVITQDIAPTVRYEGVVRCLWLNDWLDSYSANVVDAQAAAVTVLEDSLTWPATVATDGGGAVDHLALIVRAAADGDLTSVKTGVSTMECATLTEGITR